MAGAPCREEGPPPVRDDLPFRPSTCFVFRLAMLPFAGPDRSVCPVCLCTVGAQCPFHVGGRVRQTLAVTAQGLGQCHPWHGSFWEASVGLGWRSSAQSFQEHCLAADPKTPPQTPGDRASVMVPFLGA